MRRWIFPALALVLAGCFPTSGGRAEKDYAFLKDAGAPNSELCAAAEKVRRAWARERNKAKYVEWTTQRTTDCIAARETF